MSTPTKPITGLRFVWAVGAYREQFPDMPDLPDLTLWDRQERKPVVTVHGEYAQLICLETTRTKADAPFTALGFWVNGLSDSSLESEGIAASKDRVWWKCVATVKDMREPFVDWYLARDVV